MSDLWKHLNGLSVSQMDEITAMTAAKIREIATKEKYEKPIRNLFHEIIKNKMDIDLIVMKREFTVDQKWVIKMIEEFIVEQSNRKGFGV